MTNLASPLTTSLIAQQPQQSGGISVQPAAAGKSYVLDIALVLALFGAALFGVCRASRRM